MQTFTYTAGDELPGLTLPWQTETAQGVWTDLDLSSGYTFTLTLISDADGTTALTKTTNLTGANGSVVIAWATGDLALTAGNTYTMRLVAREVATSKDRSYSPDRPIKVRIV